MGLVLAARDLTLDREVAVKILLPGRAPPDAVRRFVTEAKITAQLPHPGVPPVHQLGTLADGAPFLAMKLIRGRTLAAWLGQRRDPSDDLARFVRVFEQIAQTVGFAHARGILHRDLKPHNVMVGDFGEVQVMDWGLAKQLPRIEDRGSRIEGSEPCSAVSAFDPRSSILDPRSSETAVGSVMGTPAYMAPEQARGEPVDCRADVFALGAILCEVLTGAPPFTGQSSPEVVKKAAAGDLRTALDRLDGSQADAELIALAKWCLSAEPSARPASGKEVAEAVADYRAGVEQRLRQAEADRAAAAAEAREQRKRRKVQLALGLALGLLLLGVGAAAWWQDRESRRRERERAQIEQERREQQHRRDRQEQTVRTGVAGALALAGELRKQYRFGEAADVLAGADRQLEAGLADDLRPAVARCRADLEFARRLDQIRQQKSTWIPEPDGRGRFDTTAAPPAYRAAFRARGLDLVHGRPDDLAARVAASAIRGELVAALDDWSVYEPDDRLRGRLLQVARRADPGPWTNRLRDPAVRADRTALAKLGADAGRAAVSPAALAALVELLEQRRVIAPEVFTFAATRAPGHFELMVALGRVYLKRTPVRAIVYFQAARSLRPDSLLATVNLGSACARAKDHVGALAAAREAVRMAPGVSDMHSNLAIALYEAGKLEEAAAAAEQAVRAGPKAARAHAVLGQMLHARSDVRRAAAALRTAVRLDPSALQARVNLCAVLHKLGEMEESLLAGEEAVRRVEAARDTDLLAQAYTNLAQALLACGKADEAIAACRKAIDHNPNFGLAHTNLGTALYRKKDFPGAEAAHRQALKVEPKLPEGHYNLAVLMLARRDYAGAEAECREAIRLNPKLAPAHSNLGIALHYQNNLAGAAAAYREAVRLRPDDATAHYNLGGLLHEMGDLEGAVAAGRQAVRLKPKESRHHYQLGLALLGQRDWPAAADVLKTAVALAPDDPIPYGPLGQALKAQGKFAEALKYFRRGDDLAKKRPDLRLPTAAWARECAELARADARLPDLLAGRTESRGPAELATFALLCAVYRQRYADAVRFYRSAFDGDPSLMKTLQHRRLFNAARAAVRAGLGEGIEPSPAAERPGFLQQGLDWLKLELGVRERFVTTTPSSAAGTYKTMKSWLAEPAFAAVRDAERPAALPPEEARDWRALWAAVRALRDRTAPAQTAPRPRAP
jgi:tetratricopeptide (TPR) repeat protein